MLIDNVTYLSNKFQSFLFPLYKEYLPEDEFLKKHYQIISILDVVQIEKYLPVNCPFLKGRPIKHHHQIARAFIAKHILNLSTTAQLIHHLKVDKNLRYICGWEPGQKIAHESTFSRVFKMLAETKILEEIHSDITKKIFQNHLVLHCARDSVPVEAREWPVDERGNKMNVRNRTKKKKKYPYKKTTVCQTQALETQSLDEMIDELPKHCSIGRKANSSGKSFCWRGYKLHMDVAEGWYPVSCILTSAHTHDTQAAIPLSKKTSSRCYVLYELMDSAYDSESIKTFIERKNRRALIVPRVWNGKRGNETEREQKARKSIAWKSAEDKRLQHRFASERLFSRLKECFSGLRAWVRGYKKVMCHVMLSVVALSVDELLRFLN